MSEITTTRVRRWLRLSMILVLVASLVTWLWRRESVPRHIRIATGDRNGLYYKVGSDIQEPLASRLKRVVDVVETAGSRSNFDLLTNGDADLAILQGGSVDIQDVSVVTPLFREYVFVIARKEANIEAVWDLENRKVCLGRVGSGSRTAALKVLEHFGVSEEELVGTNDRALGAILEDDSIDAAIVTAGIGHPGLQRVLAENGFDIVPIRSAMALELVHPFFHNVEIPRGLFAEHPPLPAEPIPTIATTAYLVCQNDASNELVQAALGTIHEESLRLQVPTLIARQDVPEWTATRMHSTAQKYFNPEDNIGAMVNYMESIVATKELLFAVGAGIYLLWVRWRRLKEREMEEVVRRQKEHLDRFLEETLRIERDQARTDDVRSLQDHLDRVTRIKLQALQELTQEELRGNQEFAIFFDQCSHLIGRIQRKILAGTAAQDIDV